MNVEFPLFAFEKDDRSMLLIEKSDRLLYHLEAIDIENDEYVFWDAKGAGVCVSVTHDAIDQITRCQCRSQMHSKPTHSLLAFESPFKVPPARFGDAFNRNFPNEDPFGRGCSANECIRLGLTTDPPAPAFEREFFRTLLGINSSFPESFR
jgi:hypothetical protein